MTNIKSLYLLQLPSQTIPSAANAFGRRLSMSFLPDKELFITS